MADQQRLFEHYNPLKDRVGEAFFDNLPKDPRVYKMFGRREELFYVGKANSSFAGSLILDDLNSLKWFLSVVHQEITKSVSRWA